MPQTRTAQSWNVGVFTFPNSESATLLVRVYKSPWFQRVCLVWWQAEESESSNRKLMKDNQEKDAHNQQLFKQVRARVSTCAHADTRLSNARVCVQVQQLLQDQQKLSKQVAHTHMARTQAEGQVRQPPSSSSSSSSPLLSLPW